MIINPITNVTTMRRMAMPIIMIPFTSHCLSETTLPQPRLPRLVKRITLEFYSTDRLTYDHPFSLVLRGTSLGVPLSRRMLLNLRLLLERCQERDLPVIWIPTLPPPEYLSAGAGRLMTGDRH